MALENWVDKQDGIDDILAEDINSIANAAIETQEKINKIVIDQTYSHDSENAQSGKAVAEAVSDKQDSLVSGTNIKTINNQSILGSGNITIEGGSDVEVDQIYSPTSENAQSGKAVAEAIASTVEIKPSKIDLPFEYNGGNSGEYFAKLISIDKISNTRSYLRFEFGGSTLNAYVNCPKDELVTYGLEIGKFYFIKISGEQISDKTMEIQKFSKISIDQNYNPESENAQSGKAVAEAVNTFFSDNNMEFIKEITLTEDVGMIDILTKDEGIELRDTFIYCGFLFTEKGSKYISLRKDGGNSYYGYGLDIGNYTENNITNGTPRVFGHFIYPIGETGRVLTLGLEGTPNGNVDLATGISQGLMMHSSTLSYTYSFSSQKIDNLNMFLVGSTETNLIKAGSKIWLFGRRVK